LLVKLLGIFDFLAIFTVLLSGILPQKIIVYTGGYLLFKGMFFGMAGNWISIFDAICGVFVILLAFDISNTFIMVVMILFLLQKALFSMF